MIGQLYSAPGCMATTFPKRNSKRFYTMAACYVKCDCPCTSIVSGSGLCNQCQHDGLMTRGRTEQRSRQGKTPDYTALSTYLRQQQCNN